MKIFIELTDSDIERMREYIRIGQKKALDCTPTEKTAYEAARFIFAQRVKQAFLDQDGKPQFDKEKRIEEILRTIKTVSEIYPLAQKLVEKEEEVEMLRKTMYRPR